MALAAWFYPGDNSGQEFVYPKTEAEQLSRLNKREVPSTGSEEAYPNLQERSNETASQNTNPANETQTPAPQPNPEPTNPPAASNATTPANTPIAPEREAQLPRT